MAPGHGEVKSQIKNRKEKAHYMLSNTYQSDGILKMHISSPPPPPPPPLPTG